MEKPPIFVHAWWRSGSTYIWLKLREHESCRCYYEPLHERIASLSRADTEGPPKREVTESLKHPTPKQHYWVEYADLVHSGTLKYSPELAYDRYLLQRGQTDDKLHAYIAELISAASTAGHRAVLCFCRSQMRSAWMKEAFAGIHIAQIRNPASQWKSFEVAPYFVRHMLIVALKLRCSHPLAFAHLESFERFAHNLSKRPFPIEQVPKILVSRRDALAIFLVLWMASALQVLASCDFLLDIDLLSTDLDYRSLAYDWFKSNGICTDFSDCSIPSPSGVPDNSFEQIVSDAALAIRTGASSLVISEPGAVERWLPSLSPLSRRILSLALSGK